MYHTYLGSTLDFHIEYKKRKTYSIHINPYGLVTVEVPRGTEMSHIIKLLECNWEKLMEKVGETKDRYEGSYSKNYDNKEKFLYLGNSYPIQIKEVKDIKKDTVTFHKDHLLIEVRELSDERIKQGLKRFYYKRCKAIVEERIRFYQKHFKDKPRSIKINDDSATWGTCNSRFELTFNWKLAMAPMESIDYVVVHEMCHMVHLNHDRSFWRLVGKILPDYEERKNWLDRSSWKMIV